MSGPSCRPGSSCTRCPMRSPPACRKPGAIDTSWRTIECCWSGRVGSWWASLPMPTPGDQDQTAEKSARSEGVRHQREMAGAQGIAPHRLVRSYWALETDCVAEVVGLELGNVVSN